MRAEPQPRAGSASAREESVYRRAGRLLGLSTPLHSEIELLERLEKGLSVHVLEALRARVGLTDEELYRIIGPRRTLERRAAQGLPLSSEEADRAVRIARIAAQAQRLFAARPGYAQEWLRSSQPALRDRAPLQALTSESGARAVEELLLGIEHGFFA
jgi:putative toxin-antitoxin system antitoxin component (TIGR02293 family)